MSDNIGVQPFEEDPVAIALGLTPDVDDPEVMRRVERLRARAMSEYARHPHTGPGCRDCWQLRLISKGRSADLVIFDDIDN